MKKLTLAEPKLVVITFVIFMFFILSANFSYAASYKTCCTGNTSANNCKVSTCDINDPDSCTCYHPESKPALAQTDSQILGLSVIGESDNIDKLITFSVLMVLWFFGIIGGVSYARSTSYDLNEQVPRKKIRMK